MHCKYIRFDILKRIQFCKSQKYHTSNITKHNSACHRSTISPTSQNTILRVTEVPYIQQHKTQFCESQKYHTSNITKHNSASHRSTIHPTTQNTILRVTDTPNIKTQLALVTWVCHSGTAKDSHCMQRDPVSLSKQFPAFRRMRVPASSGPTSLRRTTHQMIQCHKWVDLNLQHSADEICKKGKLN